MGAVKQEELEDELPLRIVPEFCDFRDCPALAKRVILPPNVKGDEQLSFCNHHFRELELNLVGMIVELDDCGL